jgi:hypothetical protein
MFCAVRKAGRAPRKRAFAACPQAQSAGVAADTPFRLLLRPLRLPQAATLAAAGIEKGSPVSIGSDGSRDHSFQEPK